MGAFYGDGNGNATRSRGVFGGQKVNGYYGDGNGNATRVWSPEISGLNFYASGTNGFNYGSTPATITSNGNGLSAQYNGATKVISLSGSLSLSENTSNYFNQNHVIGADATDQLLASIDISSVQQYGSNIISSWLNSQPIYIKTYANYIQIYGSGDTASTISNSGIWSLDAIGLNSTATINLNGVIIQMG